MQRESKPQVVVADALWTQIAHQQHDLAHAGSTVYKLRPEACHR
jgi:hypothetical protein